MRQRLKVRSFGYLIVAALIIAGCGGSHSALPVASRLPTGAGVPTSVPASEIEIATSPNGKATSRNALIARARYFRKRLPRGSKRSRADIFGPYATVMVQPGDSCGTNPPAWAYGQVCIGFSYDGMGIDPSCGNIDWSVDSSGLPSGATMAFAPSETAISDTVAIAVFASASAATGTYTFRVGATCSNPNSTGARPGTGEWTLAIVSTDIVDQTQASPATITAPGKLEDQVGAEESLNAKVTPTDAQAYMSNFSWSIPYSTDTQLAAYVDSYVQSNDSASMTSVTTTNNPLHFFPIAAYTGGSQLTFSGSSGTAGTAFHAATNYVIHAPTVSVDASPATVNIGTIPSNMLNSTPVLIAGWTNENQFSGDGITWSATFGSTSSYVHGQAGMTQLAGVNIWSVPSPAPGNTAPPSVFQGTNGNYYLDSGVQFGQVLLDNTTGPPTASLGANSSVIWHSVDDPHVPLLSCLDQVVVEEFFQDYFNFTPEPKANYSSIPVTVGYLSWEWMAYATRPDNQSDNTVADWGSPQIWEQPTASAFQPSTLLPTWSAFAQTSLGNGPC